MINKELINKNCLILGVVNYLEDSALVTLSSIDGVFSLLAKGVYKAKSQLKPLILVGNFVNVDYIKAKEIYIAKQVNVIQDNSILYSNLKTNSYLLLLQELSLSLYRYGDIYPEEEIKQILNYLKDGKDVLTCCLFTLSCFYNSLGIKINTDECVFCKESKNITSYSLNDGGFVCKNCQNKYLLPSIDNISLYLLKFAFMPLSDEVFLHKPEKDRMKKVIIELIDNLVSYFDLKPMKSLSFFLENN